MKFKRLFHKLDDALCEIDRAEGLADRLAHFLDRMVTEFRDDLGLVGGRLYVHRGERYAIVHEIPSGGGRVGVEVDASYAPIRTLREVGFVLLDPEDPEVDPELEQRLGVSTFAAIALGDDARHLMAFSLAEDAERDEILYTLQTIRRVVGQYLRRERLMDRVAEVREIQRSLLPPAAPEFLDFEIYGRSDPAEEVGGDLYDFLEIGPSELGVALVDSAGHGLPAALQARDAIIGLRMGVQKDMRLTATIRKLNDVIARSGLSSKFIALVYGELERNGTFVYCNAGHIPPLLLHGDGFRRLETGGRVLGPVPNAAYDRGYVRLEPGDLLLFFTDGIVEAENDAEEPYGEERIKAWMKKPWRGAAALVDGIFADVAQFSGRALPVDDQTVLAIRRRGKP